MSTTMANLPGSPDGFGLRIGPNADLCGIVLHPKIIGLRQFPGGHGPMP